MAQKEAVFSHHCEELCEAGRQIVDNAIDSTWPACEACRTRKKEKEKEKEEKEKEEEKKKNDNCLLTSSSVCPKHVLIKRSVSCKDHFVSGFLLCLHTVPP